MRYPMYGATPIMLFEKKILVTQKTNCFILILLQFSNDATILVPL